MVCTIVGAGPGLGVALAERFLRGGTDVALVARHPQRLETWRREHPSGERVGLFSADAGDAAQLEQALDDIRSQHGDTSALIYNAADMAPDRVSTLGPARLTETMTVNVGGALTCISHVLPAMRREQRGTILLTGGGLGLEPYPGWGSLAMGKAALRNLGINLHKELLSDGIHVAVVAVCGVIAPDGPFAPATVAEQYWRLHRQPLDEAQRELVYLPDGADPYYNDPEATYRRVSRPIRP